LVKERGKKGPINGSFTLSAVLGEACTKTWGEGGGRWLTNRCGDNWGGEGDHTKVYECVNISSEIWGGVEGGGSHPRWAGLSWV